VSLIRLLTTTRSLSDVKNEPSPYRMTEQGLLPKFGPKKQREVESAPPQVEGCKEEKNLDEGNGNRTDAGCSLKQESSRKPGWVSGWWQKLFRSRPRRERREPVQAELALDLVKVVRNDFEDADEAQVTSEAHTGRTRTKEKPRGAEEKQEAESVFGVSRG
jgi:hypothetical protein